VAAVPALAYERVSSGKSAGAGTHVVFALTSGGSALQTMSIGKRTKQIERTLV
jgi:hypothetical protein